MQEGFHWVVSHLGNDITLDKSRLPKLEQFKARIGSQIAWLEQPSCNLLLVAVHGGKAVIQQRFRHGDPAVVLEVAKDEVAVLGSDGGSKPGPLLKIRMVYASDSIVTFTAEEIL